MLRHSGVVPCELLRVGFPYAAAAAAADDDDDDDDDGGMVPIPSTYCTWSATIIAAQADRPGISSRRIVVIVFVHFPPTFRLTTAFVRHPLMARD